MHDAMLEQMSLNPGLATETGYQCLVGRAGQPALDSVANLCEQE